MIASVAADFPRFPVKAEIKLLKNSVIGLRSIDAASVGSTIAKYTAVKERATNAHCAHGPRCLLRDNLDFSLLLSVVFPQPEEGA